MTSLSNEQRFMRIGFWIMRLGYFTMAVYQLILANGPGAVIDPAQRWPAWIVLPLAVLFTEVLVRRMIQDYEAKLAATAEIEARWAEEARLETAHQAQGGCAGGAA